jgi:hypothetical protein
VQSELVKLLSRQDRWPFQTLLTFFTRTNCIGLLATSSQR